MQRHRGLALGAGSTAAIALSQCTRWPQEPQASAITYTYTSQAGLLDVELIAAERALVRPARY